MPAAPAVTPASVTTRKGLPLWAILSLSLAIVGPTLAMSGNASGLALSVGKSAPLVMLIGLVGVALVAYAFIRLPRHMSHSGSAYALVGRTIGPRAGFFSGFALIATYLGFSIGCAGLFASFVNSFIAACQSGSAHPYQVPWIIPALAAIAVAGAVSKFNTRSILNALLWIEGVGIAGMIILAVVIFARDGAHGVTPNGTGIDWSAFSLGHGTDFSAVLGGVVTAFLCWAGFEGCATLGEESARPKRDIPRTLSGSVMLTGILFVAIMFSQTVGFGTNAAGLKLMGASGNTEGVLAGQFIGQWFSLIIIFCGCISSFACHLASAQSTGRLTAAFARDGFFPRALARHDQRTEAPVNAIWAALGVSLVVVLVSLWTRWPSLGTGNDVALDEYFFYATAGCITLMIVYFMVEISALWFIVAPKFREVAGSAGKWSGVALTIIGAAGIVLILGFNVKDTDSGGTISWTSPVYIGLAWCLLGLVIALAARDLVTKIGKDLTTQIELIAERPSRSVVLEAAGGDPGARNRHGTTVDGE
jgi:amino acid transporter